MVACNIQVTAVEPNSAAAFIHSTSNRSRSHAGTNGIRIALGYLWLNDATSPDGAQ